MGAVRGLRIVGIAEGISYLVLLFIAMPLKYGYDQPLAVRWVGGIHGFLFLAFMFALSRTVMERGWRFSPTAPVFIASLLPFGFLFIDRKLRDEIGREGTSTAEN